MKQIKIDNLSWNPNGNAVLRNVSVSLEEGVFYGIIGPNGSGKTSLIRHILRIIQPEENTIWLDETDILKIKRRQLGQKISWVPQNTNIDAGFTASDIVLMGRTPYQKPLRGAGNTDRAMVKTAMEMTNSWHLRDKMLQTLSGGETQRVIAARAIAQDTPFILLDEPVSQLDVSHQKALMEGMAFLNRDRRKTIVVVLHDLNLASQYCQKLILLSKGEIYACGTPEEVLTPDNLLRVYEAEFHRLVHPTTGRLYLILK